MGIIPERQDTAVHAEGQGYATAVVASKDGVWYANEDGRLTCGGFDESQLMGKQCGSCWYLAANTEVCEIVGLHKVRTYVCFICVYCTYLICYAMLFICSLLDMKSNTNSLSRFSLPLLHL